MTQFAVILLNDLSLQIQIFIDILAA